MRATIDAQRVKMFELVLNMAAADVLPEAAKVVAKGALNIKTEARKRAPSGPHTRRYKNSITYETKTLKASTQAEVGPDISVKNSQAPLGHLFEYGSPTSPPIPHFAPAGDAEEPRFEKAMEDLVARLLERKL